VPSIRDGNGIARIVDLARVIEMPYRKAAAYVEPKAEFVPFSLPESLGSNGDIAAEIQK
jgi:hypothetical protein